MTAFGNRSLTDAGLVTFVVADAFTMKVRGNGRVINAVFFVASRVNHDGYHEVLGVQVATSETKPGTCSSPTWSPTA